MLTVVGWEGGSDYPASIVWLDMRIGHFGGKGSRGLRIRYCSSCLVGIKR